MDNTPLYRYMAPTEQTYRPVLSSKPINTQTYELRPRLVEMVQNHTFSGEQDENPFLHLQKFEETCDCLHIEGMSSETIRWKLFPFSLKGKARQWYDSNKEKKGGDWGTLLSEFCLYFYPLSKVVDLRLSILSSKQMDNESMSAYWERFDVLSKSGPNLAIPDQVLLQHFYVGLTIESRKELNTSANGSFIHLTASEARNLLDKIIQRDKDGPLVENPLQEEEKEEGLVEDENILDPLPTILESSEPEKTTDIEPTSPSSEFLFDIEDDLFFDYGNTTKYPDEEKPQQSKKSHPNQ